jgi:hypothetical protein
MKGDILLPRRGDLTKRAFIEAEQVGWLCGTGTVRVRPRPETDPSALFRALSTNEVNQWLLDRSVGATMPNLNTSIVEETPVRLPPEASIAVLAIEGAERTWRLAEQSTCSLVDLRSALLADLLSGQQEIPSSYDELLSA